MTRAAVETCKHDLIERHCAICTPSEAILEISLSKWERENPDVELDVLSRKMVQQLDARGREELLARLLSSALAGHRRERARRVEQDATKARDLDVRKAERERNNALYADKP